jgi:N-acetylglutamate synthase-like GNAT family acetyltransferase
MEDDTPVGVLSFRRFKRAATTEPSLFIDGLFVREELRGRGIGTALLQRAVLDAKTFASDIFIFTDRRDWYEQRGWSVIDAKSAGEPVVFVRQT